MSCFSSGLIMKNLMANDNDVNNYDVNNCDGNDGDDDDSNDIGVNKKLLDTLLESPDARTRTGETRVCALDNSSNSLSLIILPL